MEEATQRCYVIQCEVQLHAMSVSAYCISVLHAYAHCKSCWAPRRVLPLHRTTCSSRYSADALFFNLYSLVRLSPLVLAPHALVSTWLAEIRERKKIHHLPGLPSYLPTWSPVSAAQPDSLVRTTMQSITLSPTSDPATSSFLDPSPRHAIPSHPAAAALPPTPPSQSLVV